MRFSLFIVDGRNILPEILTATIGLIGIGPFVGVALAAIQHWLGL